MVAIAKTKENTVVLKITYHCPTLTRPADKSRIQTPADKALLTAQKQIIGTCREYMAIGNARYRLGDWLTKRTLPSPFGWGTFLVPISMIEEVGEKVSEMAKEYKAAGAAFAQVYPEQIELVKERLADQFNPRNYPSPKYMADGIWIEWWFFDFEIPSKEKVGAELWEQEKSRVERTWEGAVDDIQAALRESFLGLVRTLSDRLEPAADSSRKAFRGGPALKKTLEFLDIFQRRNIVDDVELAKLVEQAKDILQGKSVEDIRSSSLVCEKLYTEMRSVTTSIATLIETSPSRSITFED